MIKRRRNMLLMTLIMLSVFISPACGSKTPRAQSANARRYELKGVVESFDSQKREVTVAHEAVADYMPAMTMTFTLNEPDAFKEIERGAHIKATLVVEDDRFYLERPVITKGASSGETNKNITPLTTVDPVGQSVPEVALVDQSEQKFTFAKLRPRAVAVTFIYTRCPDPQFCILMSNKFAELSGMIESDPTLADKIQLLSVTFDPEHDTPAVLRQYLESYKKGAGGRTLSNWKLATGAPADIRRLAEFLGLSYNPENGQIAHSLVTAVIAPNGKVYKLYAGNEWKPADLLNDLRASLNEK